MYVIRQKLIHNSKYCIVLEVTIFFFFFFIYRSCQFERRNDLLWMSRSSKNLLKTWWNISVTTSKQSETGSILLSTFSLSRFVRERKKSERPDLILNITFASNGILVMIKCCILCISFCNTHLLLP